MEMTPYSVHPYLRDRWDRVGRSHAFSATTAGEWQEWRRALREKLRALTGYDSMVRTGPSPRITDEVDCGDYVRQRVEIDTEPAVTMPLFVLIPSSGSGPWVPVIAPHGHSSGGKLSVAGIRDRPEIAKTIDHYNYAYGVAFVRAGFIVFAPDARGFGERQEKLASGNILESSCRFINNMAYPLGQTVTGMWAWDLHRLIDYIETRPDCRADRVGCAGLSGGGLQTLWAAALDDRVSCAVISGYLYGYRDSLLDLHGNCSCNYVPHLYETADMGDVAALIAPRPLLIETGTQDGLNGENGLANVDSQMAILRRAYGLLGKPENLAQDIFEGEHRWNGVQAVPWLVEHLQRA